jgi:hypothetical protein
VDIVGGACGTFTRHVRSARVSGLEILFLEQGIAEAVQAPVLHIEHDQPVIEHLLIDHRAPYTDDVQVVSFPVLKHALRFAFHHVYDVFDSGTVIDIFLKQKQKIR